jgi:hypothetical protein
VNIDGMRFSHEFHVSAEKLSSQQVGDLIKDICSVVDKYSVTFSGWDDGCVYIEDRMDDERAAWFLEECESDRVTPVFSFGKGVSLPVSSVAK